MINFSLPFLYIFTVFLPLLFTPENSGIPLTTWGYTWKVLHIIISETRNRVEKGADCFNRETYKLNTQYGRRRVSYAVRVRALAGDIEFTLTVPLSIEVFQWVNGKFNTGANLKVKTLLVTWPSNRNQTKEPAWWTTWLACRWHLTTLGTNVHETAMWSVIFKFHNYCNTDQR